MSPPDIAEVYVDGERRTKQNEGPDVELSAPDTRLTPGDTVSLSTDASDSDGQISSYSWTGVTSSDGNNASWTVPHGYPGPDHQVSVTVEDNDGATASDTLTLSVDTRPGGGSGGGGGNGGSSDTNEAPSVSLEASDPSPGRRTEVTLTANADDPDGDAITNHRWTGVDSSNGNTATWTVPDRYFGHHKITVTVEDEHGATDSASVTLEVDTGFRGGPIPQ